MPGPVEAADDRDQSVLSSRKAGLGRPIVAILVTGVSDTPGAVVVLPAAGDGVCGVGPADDTVMPAIHIGVAFLAMDVWPRVSDGEAAIAGEAFACDRSGVVGPGGNPQGTGAAFLRPGIGNAHGTAANAIGSGDRARGLLEAMHMELAGMGAIGPTGARIGDGEATIARGRAADDRARRFLPGCDPVFALPLEAGCRPRIGNAAVTAACDGGTGLIPGNDPVDVVELGRSAMARIGDRERALHQRLI